MSIVRVFESADAARCCDIINTCVHTMDGLNQAAREYLYVKNTPAALAHELQHMFSLVAEDQGVVVGVGGLAGHEIKRLYVQPAAQGQGIGTALLLVLEAEAKRRGVHRLLAQASPSAASFYARHGYASLGSDSLQVGEAEFHVVNMEKVG